MRFGHCKNCFWYKWGHCFMLHVETRKESYCPDFYSRSASNETLKQVIDGWIAQKQLSLSELNDIINNYKNSKQKGNDDRRK